MRTPTSPLREAASNVASRISPSKATRKSNVSPKKDNTKRRRKGSRNVEDDFNAQLEMDQIKEQNAKLEEYKQLKAEILQRVDELRQLHEDLEKGQGAGATMENIDNYDVSDLSDSPIYIIRNGRVMQVDPSTKALFAHELNDNLEGVDDEVNTRAKEELRRKKGYVKVRYGASYCWIPRGASITGTSWLTKLQRAAKIKKKLDDIFSGERCTLSREAMIILAAFGMHNYGGSDEAMEMAIAGSWAALLLETGYVVDPKKLSKFPDTELQLDAHHTVSNGPIKVNVREAMKFLCKYDEVTGSFKCDFFEILEKDRFVKKFKEDIVQLAASEETVRLFDRKDGKSLHHNVCLQ